MNLVTVLILSQREGLFERSIKTPPGMCLAAPICIRGNGEGGVILQRPVTAMSEGAFSCLRRPVGMDHRSTDSENGPYYSSAEVSEPGGGNCSG
jgi:hypothetical protein